MCEVLVKAIDGDPHADPVKDRSGVYKSGYPVVVFEDGHTWGSSEGLPKFWIIKLPGIAADLLREAIAEQTEEDDGVDRRDPTDPYPPSFRRRRWKLDFASLPQSAKTALNSTGIYTASNPSQIAGLRSSIKRIRDGVTYTGF